MPVEMAFPAPVDYRQQGEDGPPNRQPGAEQELHKSRTENNEIRAFRQTAQTHQPQVDYKSLWGRWTVRYLDNDNIGVETDFLKHYFRFEDIKSPGGPVKVQIAEPRPDISAAEGTISHMSCAKQ